MLLKSVHFESHLLSLLPLPRIISTGQCVSEAAAWVRKHWSLARWHHQLRRVHCCTAGRPCGGQQHPVNVSRQKLPLRPTTLAAVRRQRNRVRRDARPSPTFLSKLARIGLAYTTLHHDRNNEAKKEVQRCFEIKFRSALVVAFGCAALWSHSHWV